MKILLTPCILLLLVSCQKYVYEYHPTNNINVEQINSLLFPEGLDGEAILFTGDTIYTVPKGFALYVINLEKVIDTSTNREYYNYNNYLSEQIKDKLVIIAPEKTIKIEGFFNGLLIKNTIEIINWDTDTVFNVSTTSDIYLTSFLAMGLKIDDVVPETWAANKGEIFSPLIIPGGTKLEHNGKYIFTGYYKPLPIDLRRNSN
ncbi:MAG: hypothetical protein ACERKD_19765 [Prolixibacteraceae bacterium]